VDRSDWDRRYRAKELLWSAEPCRSFVGEVEGLVPGRALDLACGEGRNAVWLAERGWRVTAVDFSPVALAKARRLAAARGAAVEWVEADLLRHRPEPGEFDLVAVLYLQLPSALRRFVLARAAAALAPGGTLLVVGHDLANLDDGHGGPREPAVLMTPEDVAAELPALVVERAERVRRAVHTEHGEATAIDTLVRARRKPTSDGTGLAIASV
jgi:SAM-dependent methyltransferase